jgi:hydrogenase nickel incorporation protein HypA/HybF
MHELPVTESILDIAVKHAKRENATRITDLYLVIGQLASFIDESIQFYWGIIAKDTIAEGAILHFKRLPAEFKCLDCGTIFSPSNSSAFNDYSCPNCSGYNVQLTCGDEFYLEAIDVENNDTQ